MDEKGAHDCIHKGALLTSHKVQNSVAMAAELEQWWPPYCDQSGLSCRCTVWAN